MTADTEPPEVRAYLPAHEAPALRNVQAGSAIVSHHEYVHSPDDPEGPARVLVYFEGNKYGASNMVTYADRQCSPTGGCASATRPSPRQRCRSTS